MSIAAEILAIVVRELGELAVDAVAEHLGEARTRARLDMWAAAKRRTDARAEEVLGPRPRGFERCTRCDGHGVLVISDDAYTKCPWCDGGRLK